MPAMPNWWMPPTVGGSITGNQIGRSGPAGTTQTTSPAYEQYMRDFMLKQKQLRVTDPGLEVDPLPFSSWANRNTRTNPQTSPTNPIPQNWMQVISDLMNKPPVPTPAAGSPTQAPTSKTTNTGVQDALQKIIGRFGGGAATAQPTQMPSWWNTGRSVYPWGRGSTF